MTTVLQDWVIGCTWKEQTVLLCALRGPDAAGSEEVKALTRWIRRIVLHNAAPKKTFMRRSRPKRIDYLAENSPLVFDLLPVHYLSHLMHALQVIAVRHPRELISKMAREAYKQLCNYLHVNPETDAQMTERLKDEN